MTTPFHHFINSFLRSFSQIMLQRNALTGLLFCLGIGLNSPTMLLGGVIATLSGLFTASLGKFTSESIQSGLYGFNSALVGIAVFFFLPFDVISLVLAIFGGVLSTVTMHFILVKIPKIPAFTAPFVISTWLLLAIIDTAGIKTSTTIFTTNAIGDFFIVMRGVSQVMFQDYWLCGVFFIAGLLLHSFKAATWAVIGSCLGMLLAGILNFSDDLVLMGIYSFNASLVAIALSARYEKKLLLIFLGVLFSVLLTDVFEQITLPVLTAPFVLACWLTIGFVKVCSTITNRISECRSL
ncbi:urea transporter [Thalassotalea fonticola]|uniref:Urea transporter n=1 Tax=Thalassotalea fonticola TaxID=3065649 RepID=A0ABZ0GJK9_9GAMM|nr:urea transporter [Colwelliaceae bacterium S1-1]